MRSLMLALILAACGGAPSGPGPDAQGAVEGPAPAKVELPRATYLIQADKGDGTVPAELGGPGFTGDGWETRLDQYGIGVPDAPTGGIVTMQESDWPATLRTLGPHSNAMTNSQIKALLFQPLLTRDPVTDDWIPALATHWQVSDDNTTYRFRLNPAARWSDGSEVTADDVVATWTLAVDPETLDPSQAMVLGRYEQPVALSKYVVEVKVKTPHWRNFDFFAQLNVLPALAAEGGGKAYLERYQFAVPPHSGPYTLREADIVTGTSLTFTRRADWWDRDNPVYQGWFNVDGYKVVVVADEALAWEKFKKGELDFWTPNAEQWHEELQELDAVKRGLVVLRRVFTQSAEGFNGIAINMQRAPTDDVRVRKALQLLFDRPTMIARLYYGELEPLSSFHQRSPYQRPNASADPYDEVGAVELLEQAGWTAINAEGYREKDGKELTFTLLYPAPRLERVLTIYQESCKRAGIRLELQLSNPATHFKTVSSKEFDLAFAGFTGLRIPNPETAWSGSMAAQPNNNNIVGFADPRADALIQTYNTSFDPAERQRAIQELDQILFDAHPYVLFWYTPGVRMAYWNRFGSPPWGAGRYLSGEAMTQVWWVDSEKDAQVAAAKSDPSVTLEIPPVDLKFWQDYELPASQ